MSDQITPPSVTGLYRQLVCERAGQTIAQLVQEPSVERLFCRSALALEDAAGVLLHAARALVSHEGQLRELFSEQAGALLAVAARFEEAADVHRSRESGEDNDGEEAR